MMIGGVTVSGIGGDVDPLNFVASVGVKTAVSECVPVVNVDVIVNARPLMTVTGLPIFVSPSLNCTVPAAVRGRTIALRLTGKSEGNEPLGVVISMVVLACAPDPGVGVTTGVGEAIGVGVTIGVAVTTGVGVTRGMGGPQALA